MKKFAIFPELPKCDRDKKSATAAEKWCREFLKAGLPQTFNFLRNALSMKYNQVKHNKTNCACTVLHI